MAATPEDIRIPADLLPADGRFGAGPSKVRKEQVDALAVRWCAAAYAESERADPPPGTRGDRSP